MGSFRLFISYSSKDRQLARSIDKQLRSKHEVWRDERRIETDWSREIATALSEADAVVLLWTANAKRSKWVRHEWLTARALGKRIEIAMFPGCPELPKPLENLQAVAFSARSAKALAAGSRKLIVRLATSGSESYDYDFSRLPERSNVPFGHNEHFRGRQTDLLDLYLDLIGGLNKIGINQIGISGMGGIGKTQLAVEFAYRFGFGFDEVYWIQAGDPAEWRAEFIALARNHIGLDVDSGAEDRDWIRALRRHFSDSGLRTLVIMDNVVDPQLLNQENFLLGETPLSLGCDLLFTTRRRFDLPGVEAHAVDILPLIDSLALLGSYRQPKNKAERSIAEEICQTLGCLPLAITLAGAFLREYRSEISFSDYLDGLREDRLRTVDIGKLSPDRLATRHDAAVKSTLKSQWQMLQDPLSQRLMKLAAQFPQAQIIPKARLGLLAGSMRGRFRLDRPLDRAFHRLRTLSLMEEMGDEGRSVRLHPLVHDFVHRLTPARSRKALRHEAASQLSSSLLQFVRLEQEMLTRGVGQVLGDLDVGIDWNPPHGAEGDDLRLLRQALQLSAAALSDDPAQLAAQLIARLSGRKTKRLTALLEKARAKRQSPWLRPHNLSLTPPGTVLIGSYHHPSITCLGVSASGRLAATGSYDGSVKVWDVEAEQELWTFPQSEAVCERVAISDDERILWAAYDYGPVRAWNLADGSEYPEKWGEQDEVKGLGVATNGSQAVAVYDKGVIETHDLNGEEPTRRIEAWGPEVGWLEVAPDGSTVLLGRDNGALRVERPLEGVRGRTLRGHRGELETLRVTPDGSLAAVQWKDAVLEVWDLASHRKLRQIDGCSVFEPSAFALAADGSVAVASDYDVEAWDLNSGELIGALTDIEFRVMEVSVSDDGRVALIGDSGGFLHVWQPRANRRLWLKRAHGLEPKIAILPSRERALTASMDGYLKVWSLRPESAVEEPATQRGTVFAVALTSDGRTAVSGSDDHTVWLWDVASGRSRELGEHGGGVLRVAMTRGGSVAVSGSRSGDVIAWDLRHGGEPTYLGSHDGKSVQAVALSADGAIAVSGGHDQMVRVWDVREGVELACLGEPVHGDRDYMGWINDVAISADGRIALSGSGEPEAKLWDLERLELVRTLPGSGEGVYASALSRDGSTALIGTGGIVRAFGLGDGRKRQIRTGGNECHHIALTPDGKRAVLDRSSEEGTLLIWDFRGRSTPPRPLTGHSEMVSALCITPDGRRAASAGLDNTIRVWDLVGACEITRFTSEFHPRAIAISEDARTVVAGTDSGRVHFLELLGLKPPKRQLARH